jgi:uncharacterized membrane protein YedE/YeeE
MRRPGIAEIAAAFAAGAIFGAGLIVSGMSNPAKVLGFLDVAGLWDPSLALVMAGAIGVGVIGFALNAKRARSVLGLPMRIHAPGAIDRPLVIGAVVFGVGWGLVGLCPGPAVVALSTGSAKAFLFFAAMIAGMLAYDLSPARRSGGRD